MQEFHIELQDDDLIKQKASSILAEASGLSIKTIKDAMHKGAVWLEDAKGVRRVRRADTKLTKNNILHFYYYPEVLAQEPLVPKLLADEGDYSVWNKPAGMLCQGSKWSDHCTITRWIETNAPFKINPQRNCFIVHRLDKATSGLVIVAHTKKATQQLTKLFEQRKVKKIYHAVVEGKFPKEQQEFTSQVNNKDAHSIAKRLSYDEANKQSLVEVEIKTGRKHQVRVHLSQAGYPIVGDRLYGNANSDSVDLQLYAYHLSFICPITEQEKTYCLI